MHGYIRLGMIVGTMLILSWVSYFEVVSGVRYTF